MAHEKKPTAGAIRDELDRILQSPVFRGSDKQKGFLKFIVNETLAGNTSQLKGYTVAVSVYGRRADFDPQTDPIVRVEARRLRNALEHYYLTAGKNDPVRIRIPKGGYVPVFQNGQIQPPDITASVTGSNNGAFSDKPSIAVMPLFNFTGDKKQDYFVDGITEELTSEFYRYQDLRVIASQSALQLKGKRINPIEVGKDLGANYLVMGSLRKDSNSVKVTIRLVKASTAEQVWGKSYTRKISASNLIRLQEEIAQNTAGLIADQYGFVARIMSKESVRMAPHKMKAYDAILRFYHYETLLTPEAFKDALAAIEQAVKIEPQYGLAWAMRSHLYSDNYAMEFCDVETPLEKALKFAKKAISLSPGNQFARDALALVYFHLCDKALFLNSVEEAIALNPNAPYIVGVAGWHMALFGEWERGLTLLQKGMQLNPYYPTWFHLAPFFNHYRQGKFENALSEALKFNYPGLFWDPLLKAAALGQAGRLDEAGASIRELLKLIPDFEHRGRMLIGRYLKVNDLVDKVIEGLQKGGLDVID